MIVTRVYDFLAQTLKNLREMTVDEFKKYAGSVKIEYLEKDIKLKDKGNRICREIFRSEFIFDRKERMVTIIDSISKEEFVNFAEDLLVNNARRLDLEIVCKNHKKKNEKLYKKNEKKYSTENKINRIKIDSLDKFRLNAMYHTDLNRERYLNFLKSLNNPSDMN